MALFGKKNNKDKGASAADEKPKEVAPAASTPTHGDSASYAVVYGPHVTEKASLGNAIGKYVFRVSGTANKIEISHAIEKLYKVKVSNVHLLHMPSKKRQVGRHQGEKSGFKKAVVTLQKGQTIDIT